MSIILFLNCWRIILGFLSTNDDVAPGNWAFKDQLAVLKWVQKNIASFNGDKNKVTIFGQSAGAGSVHYHLLSPATKSNYIFIMSVELCKNVSILDLFHGAITQSGSALALWAKPLGAIQSLVAQMQAATVNCSNEINSLMVDCMRRVDADVLANSIQYFKVHSSCILLYLKAIIIINILVLQQRTVYHIWSGTGKEDCSESKPLFNRGTIRYNTKSTIS